MTSEVTLALTDRLHFIVNIDNTSLRPVDLRRLNSENFVWMQNETWPWPWFIPYPTGHIGPHSDAIRVCQELPPVLPPRWTPFFVGLCWLCSASSLLVDLVLSCILVPASTVIAVVFAGGPQNEAAGLFLLPDRSQCGMEFTAWWSAGSSRWRWRDSI